MPNLEELTINTLTHSINHLKNHTRLKTLVVTRSLGSERVAPLLADLASSCKHLVNLEMWAGFNSLTQKGNYIRCVGIVTYFRSGDCTFDYHFEISKNEWISKY